MEDEEEEEGEGGRNREGEGGRGREGEGEEEEGGRASHLLKVEASINKDQEVDLDSACAGRSASKEMSGDKPSEYALEGAVTDVDMTSMSLETVTDEKEEEEEEGEEEGEGEGEEKGEEEGDGVELVRRGSATKDRGRSNRRRRSSVLFAYLGRRGSFSPSFIKLPRRQSWRVADVERRGGEEEEEEEGEEEEEEEMGRGGRWRRWVRDAGRSTKKALKDLKLLLM